MKKVTMVALLLLLATSMAQAETVKQSVKQTAANIGDFWRKEGERSGIHMPSTSSMGNFWNNINPVNFLQKKQEEFNARKAAETKK